MSPLLVLLAAGCPPAPECSETVACPFGSSCVDGRCQEQRCSTSTQCGMEHFCDAGSCTPGCAEDADCYPGQACDLDTRSCVTAACTESRVDCDFGQFCNEYTGECYDAGGYYCKPCVSDDDCGGNGNHCTGWGYCGVSCSSDEDCPAGYGCLPFVDYNYNVQYYQCITYCWDYEDAKDPPALPPVPGAVPPGQAGRPPARKEPR